MIDKDRIARVFGGREKMMDKDRIVRVLETWFGRKEFKVADIQDRRIPEIARLMDIGIPDRSQLGRLLSRLAREMADDRGLRLVLKSEACGSYAAVYQVQGAR